MGTIVDNNGEKRELDDSGCIQDDSAQLKMAETEGNGYPPVTLLDLSDDVLLYILRHCSPRDLKALGFSCPRLGRLVRERSLWRRVDARSEQCGAARLQWYAAHALHADTRELLLRGYAEESQGCVGLLNCSRKEAEDEQRAFREKKRERERTAPSRVSNLQRYHACLYISAHSSSRLPKYRGTPVWAEDEKVCRPHIDLTCAGPRFTASEPLLRLLRARCPALSCLALEYCNIAANMTNLGHLPPTLKKLSLRGTKCFNLTVDKSFLFKIQDHLPLLESLDVSECEWMEPASLLPLSKHPSLKELYMRDCYRLAEFVAYASLSSRYGFRKLEILDLRGSPVGDSEVAPLAWLPALQQLKLSALSKPLPLKHAHYADDVRARRRDLDDWELEEPEYFRAHIPDPDKMESDGDSSVHTEDEEPDSDDGDSDDNADDFKPRFKYWGESSKADQTPKGKPENGSGDPEPQRKDQNKRKRDFGHDPMSTDEERYEKRRCQTIVIVDRRTYDESVQDDLVPPEIEAIEAPGPSGEAQCNPPAANQDNVEIIEIVCDQKVNDAYNANVGSDFETDDEGRGKEKPERKTKKGKRTKNKKVEVNMGASTSRDYSEPSERTPNERTPNERTPNERTPNERTPNEPSNEESEVECCVRFRQGERPEVVEMDPSGLRSRRLRFEPEANPDEPRQDEEDPVHRRLFERARLMERNPHIMNLIRNIDPRDPSPPGNFDLPNLFPDAPELCPFRNEPEPPEPLPLEGEPRHRVLYVNVGQPANAYGPLPNLMQAAAAERDRLINVNRSHLMPSALVTDSAVRRFGRSAGTDIRFVLVGLPHPFLGPNSDYNNRPDRSSLRVLIMNGYRNITDRSLVHLATAAPFLRFLDFRETNVTPHGVENFRSLRPDVEVVFSPYKDRKAEIPKEQDD